MKAENEKLFAKLNQNETESFKYDSENENSTINSDGRRARVSDIYCFKVLNGKQINKQKTEWNENFFKNIFMIMMMMIKNNKKSTEKKSKVVLIQNSTVASEEEVKAIDRNS